MAASLGVSELLVGENEWIRGLLRYRRRELLLLETGS
jgi:hypothetical protein